MFNLDHDTFKEGDLCPWCSKGTLELCPEIEPWSSVHFICDQCDSTYDIYQDKEQMIYLINKDRENRISWEEIIGEEN